MKLLEIISGGREPVLVMLLTSFGWKRKNALLVAALLQVLAILLLIIAIAMFAEWRFVQWEQLGCKAYCSCASRIGNMTYSF